MSPRFEPAVGRYLHLDLLGKPSQPEGATELPEQHADQFFHGCHPASARSHDAGTEPSDDGVEQPASFIGADDGQVRAAFHHIGAEHGFRRPVLDQA